jgi:hypothetical protein
MECAKLRIGLNIIAAAMWSVPALADPPAVPPMCPPGTESHVCAVIIDRNNAMTQKDNAEGDKADALGKLDAYQSRDKFIKDYWKRVWATLPLPGLEARVHAVCAWRGVENKPTADLCAWLKGQKK